ncbi:MAG: metallophosphoesterase [Spirochaetes bacterium]|nr:MAG: metallophosphoesterase [Spirochaetota bacterium]
MNNLKRTAAILSVPLVLVISMLVYSFAIERYLVEYHEIPVEVEGLPAEFQDFRIMVISDLHAGSLMPRSWVERVIDAAQAQHKDAIFLLGDYVHARDTRKELDMVYPLLSKLSAPDGVYAVNGNHDHWADHGYALTLLVQSGRAIEHGVRVIRRGDAHIAVAGLGDYTEDRYGIDSVGGIPEGQVLIVLAHNPDSTEIGHSRRVSLFVCGHTHGGQVRIPLKDYAPVIPVIHRELDAGIRKNSRGETVFISRGIGWAVLPFRFNCRPEIPVLVLKRKG